MRKRRATAASLGPRAAGREWRAIPIHFLAPMGTCQVPESQKQRLVFSASAAVCCFVSRMHRSASLSPPGSKSLTHWLCKRVSRILFAACSQSQPCGYQNKKLCPVARFRGGPSDCPPAIPQVAYRSRPPRHKLCLPWSGPSHFWGYPELRWKSFTSSSSPRCTAAVWMTCCYCLGAS